ncbi:hypothetical protein A142_14435 [Vibrio splendidus 12E03]|uniref:Uncharacterized protein n=2 Tax=Vibrio splendidus TaxID=29497 RepID=A0A1E5FXP7_VIBSP|nr:hypothetical protein A142_14435 [Vibrio splendidus 12E03]
MSQKRKDMKRGDTTVRVNEDRKMKLQRGAIKVGNQTGQLLKISDIVNHLIDNYSEEAIQDLIHKKTD